MNKSDVSTVIIIWAILSLLASAIKLDEDACNKSYPIDHVLYTNAFCEIEKEHGDG